MESHKYGPERKKSKRAFILLYSSVYVKCQIEPKLISALRCSCSDIGDWVGKQ